MLSWSRQTAVFSALPYFFLLSIDNAINHHTLSPEHIPWKECGRVFLLFLHVCVFVLGWDS